MKRAGLCFWLMLKRMGRHPVYWILLLLFPAALFAVPRFNRAAETERIAVGYVVEEMEGAGTARDAREEMEEAGITAEYAVEEMEGAGTTAEYVVEETEGAGTTGEYAVKEMEGTETAKDKWMAEEPYYDGEIQSDQTGGIASLYSRQMPRLIEEKFSEVSERAGSAGGSDKNIFQYIKYTDKNALIQDVRTGEISCGVLFDRDFPVKLMEQDYRHCITLYVPEGMNVGGMVQEDVFRQVYQVYSAVWYAGLLREQGVQTEPEQVLRKFSEYQKEGKVFAVSYEETGREGEPDQNVQDGEEDEVSLLSVRGILAFLTFMSASIGALEGSRERKKGAGKGICCPTLLKMAAVGAPVLLSALFLAVGMIYTDIKTAVISSAGGQAELAGIASGGLLRVCILPEVVSALSYGLILWLLAMLFARILPEKLLEGIMPCFLLIVLLCCPVFFDLGESVPLAGYISKLFPLTWYLRFWG